MISWSIGEPAQVDMPTREELEGWTGGYLDTLGNFQFMTIHEGEETQPHERH